MAASTGSAIRRRTSSAVDSDCLSVSCASTSTTPRARPNTRAAAMKINAIGLLGSVAGTGSSTIWNTPSASGSLAPTTGCWNELTRLRIGVICRSVALTFCCATSTAFLSRFSSFCRNG
ncbi:MAG: hypothetical protein U1E76_10240 [Planctomycetota bacterium]